jgi:hypothetical protein
MMNVEKANMSRGTHRTNINFGCLLWRLTIFLESLSARFLALLATHVSQLSVYGRTATAGYVHRQTKKPLGGKSSGFFKKDMQT